MVSNTSPVILVMATLACAIITPAAGALLLLPSSSVFAQQQEETSLGEEGDDLASGIVSGVLDGSSDDEEDDNIDNEENEGGGAATAGDDDDGANAQIAVQITDQDQREANLAEQLGLNVDIVEVEEEEEVTPTPTPPTPPTGTVTVFKQVVGGTAQPSDFTMRVEGNNPSPSTFQGSSSGTTVTLGQGSYQVTETTVADDYTPSFSSGCSGTISAAQTQTCTVTNTFTPPTTTPTVFCYTVEFTSTVVSTHCFSTEDECGTGEEVITENGLARILSSCQGFETIPQGGEGCSIGSGFDPDTGQQVRFVSCP